MNSTEKSGTNLSGSSKLRVLGSDVTQSEFRGLAGVPDAWMPSSHPTSKPPTAAAAASIAPAACKEISSGDEEIFVSGVIVSDGFY